MMSEFFKNLIRSSFIYGLGAIASPIVGFFLLPVYTRLLTPSDYGILETLATTTSIITIFLIFGMDNSLFRFSFDAKDDQHQKRIVATSSIFLWALAISITTLLILNADFISHILFNVNNYATYLTITFLSAAMATIQMIPMNIFRINNQPTRYVIISLSQTLLITALNILFVAGLNKGVFGFMLGTLIANIIITTFAYYLIKTHIYFGFSFSLLRSMLKYAIPVIPAGLSLWILGLSDRYFLLAYSTTSEVGLYSIGVKFASVVGLIITAFRLAWPQAAFSVLNIEDRNNLYARTLTYFVFISCSVFLVISLFGNELVKLMTTEQFHKGATVIPLLALGLIFNGCYTIFAIGMNVTKKMSMIFPVTAVPAGLNLVLNYFLIPNYGMMGAAWATIISTMLMAFLSWLASERVYHIDYEWGSLAKILTVTLVILGASRFITLEQLYYLMPAKVGLVATYVTTLYLLKIPSKQDYEALMKIAFSLGFKSWSREFASKNQLSPNSGQDQAEDIKT